ncbi:MAG: DUF58 domain-containing protein [Pirellulaceae bacterium]
MPLFDSEFLKRLEYLSLVSRRIFRGKLLAQRRTKQLGGGIEFADHREYTPGDDLRYLDWNLFARYDSLLLKRFQEEQDLHVYILLDVSQSMNAGNPNKFDYVRKVAAAMAYIALADMDRVGILAYANDVRATLPLTRGKERILTILKFLEQLKTAGTGTNLQAVSKNLVNRAERSGLVIILSDLFDQDGFRRGIDILRHRRFEPHVIQIHTTAEANPTWLGDVELEEVENGELRKITITERKLRQYRTLFEEFLKGIDKYCRDYSMSCSRTTTELPFDELILKMMRATALAS